MSAFESSLVIKDNKGDTIFLTTTGNHGKFTTDFETEMGRKSLGPPLSNNDDYFPIRPDAAYHRRERTPGFGVFTHYDQREISDYIRAKGIWDGQCEQVIAFLRAALEKTVQTAVETRVRDPWKGNRPCIRQVIAVLAQLYGGWTHLKGQRNYDEMTAVAVFTTVENTQSALAKLDALRLEREGWANDPAPYGDGMYRAWLLQRMRDWDILSVLRSTLILDETLTFDACRIRLNLTIADKAEQKDEAVQRQRQIAAMAGPTGHRGVNYINSSMTSFSANRVVGDTGFACYNCNMPTHAAKDCQELWCNKCGMEFAFLGCPGYHGYYDCSLWNRKRSATDDGMEQQQQRPRMTFQQQQYPPRSEQQYRVREHPPYQQSQFQPGGQNQQSRSQFRAQPRQQQPQYQFQSRGQPQQSQSQLRGQPLQQQNLSQPRWQHQQRAQQPAAQPQTARQPWNNSRTQQSGPTSRFAGHAGTQDDPIHDEALEAIGIDEMPLEQAMALTARLQSYTSCAAAYTAQGLREEDQSAGGVEYTQPWEHVDSDF